MFFGQRKLGGLSVENAFCIVSLLLLCSLSSRSAQAWSSQLRRYPYLTDVVGAYATINWATDRSSPVSTVKWGKVGSESCTAHSTAGTRTNITVNSAPEYQWKALLTLEPDTEFCYRVYLGNKGEVDLLGADPSPHFWTQVPVGSAESYSFVVFGDWGEVDANGQNPHLASIMQQIAASGARFALTAGDNAYPAGSQTNYGDLVQSGPDMSGVFGPSYWKVPGASMPIFPAMGNHGLSVSDPHLLNWPQDRAVASSNGRYVEETYCCRNGIVTANYASPWYAFDAGPARFYVLDAAWTDTNIGIVSAYQNDYDYHWSPNSAEYQWLAQDLAAHPAALKFAFFHFPLYADIDSDAEATDPFLHGANSLEGLLSQYGVSIAFTGHAHLYQRNLKPHANSVVSYVTGGGGAHLAPIGRRGCSPFTAYGIGWFITQPDGPGSGSACGSAPVPTSSNQVYHFLLVSVNGTTVTVTPTDEMGRTFDVQMYDFGLGRDGSPQSVPSRSQTTGATQDIQPTLPIRAAFYYPWFPEAWTQKDIYPYTNYVPTHDYYDSSNPTLIRQHIAAMQYGNIQAGIVSWWGQGTASDHRFAQILSATAGNPFRWSIYYEQEGLANPSADEIKTDLTYLFSQYASDSSYLRIGGRFVIFVYADRSDGCEMAERWKAANSVNAYIVLKVFAGYGNCAAQPDGWHQYAPAVAADQQKGFSYTISPGFWEANDYQRLRRDLRRWCVDIRDMVAAGEPFQLITTFNEWGEGTAVESSYDWASSSGFGTYLDALHNNGMRCDAAPQQRSRN